MSLEDKQRLLKLLQQSHASIQTLLAGIDLQLPVYLDSGWRIRDILGHIATWDRQVAHSLRAYCIGQEYTIPDLDEGEFNEQSYLNQLEMTGQQIVEEWEQARHELIQVVGDIPLALFPGDLLYPWGDERGTIANLVNFSAEHDIEHRDEIVKALDL